MKWCSLCGEAKPLTEFGVATIHRRGRTERRVSARCRSCVAAKTRVWAAKNRDRALERGRQRRLDPKFVAGQREYLRQYYLDNKERLLARMRERRQADGTRYDATKAARHPDQIVARRRLHTAVLFGRVTKPNKCQGCGNPFLPEQLHGHHHHGYDEAHWLDVLWLCSACHGLAHRT